MFYIIVTQLSNSSMYQLEERYGDIPPNFVCYAPENEQDRKDIEEDLANGNQTLTQQWVENNT